jgi:hypothetical protein
MSLRPYDPAEWMGTAEAAKLAGVSEYTVRIWSSQYDIGRKVAGRWRVSRTRLALLLNGQLNSSSVQPG